jgi:nucleoside-triphosphatase
MSQHAKPKILITGPPGCGKTTLIKKVAEKIDAPICGFYTNEIRHAEKRIGFEIETFNEPSRKGILSHIEIESPYRVGKYGVDVRAFEQIAIPELENAINQKTTVIIDEIGKMELFSTRFRELLGLIFQSDISILASIYYKSRNFCDRLKKHPDVQLINMTPSNRAELARKILELLI